MTVLLNAKADVLIYLALIGFLKTYGERLIPAPEAGFRPGFQGIGHFYQAMAKRGPGPYLEAVIEATYRRGVAGIGYHGNVITQLLTGIQAHLYANGGVNANVTVNLMSEPHKAPFRGAITQQCP